jgi:hypothetical protein
MGPMMWKCADEALIADESNFRGCAVIQSGDERGDASGQEVAILRHLVRPVELRANRKEHEL